MCDPMFERFVITTVAWIGHFFIEHNRPATFKYPLRSFMGDYHMFVLWLTGQLSRRQKLAEDHLMPAP